MSLLLLEPAEHADQSLAVNNSQVAAQPVFHNLTNPFELIRWPTVSNHLDPFGVDPFDLCQVRRRGFRHGHGHRRPRGYAAINPITTGKPRGSPCLATVTGVKHHRSSCQSRDRYRGQSGTNHMCVYNINPFAAKKSDELFGFGPLPRLIQA